MGMWWEITWTGGPSECPQVVVMTVEADSAEAAEALSVHYVHDEMSQLFCLQVRPAAGPHQTGHTLSGTPARLDSDNQSGAGNQPDR